MATLAQSYDPAALCVDIANALTDCQTLSAQPVKNYSLIRSLADEGLAAVVLYNRCRDEGMDEPFAFADTNVEDVTTELRGYAEMEG